MFQGVEYVSFFLVLLFTLFHTHAEPTGSNTCRTPVVENKQINVTFLQSKEVKEYKFCLTQLTLRCAEYKSVMETKWKLENISRAVIQTTCCPGYREVEGLCAPHCSSACINGVCLQPETCHCSSGFSGNSCEISGCPERRWGPNCASECECQHGGFCSPVHGGCTCTPGYHGVRCQDRCPEGYYGAGCSKDCSCGTGTTCNHVTGECVPCAQGLYGAGCRQHCSCEAEGAELCSSIDGKCFCKDNRFGLRCELFCPFGYINNTCYKAAINNDSCQCSNHLYTCDLERGCVCPPGVDCGIQEMASQELEKASLSGDTSQSHVTAAVVSVLIIGLVAVVLVIVYYRRRLKVLKTDLRNRSVRYTLNPHPTQSQDFVIHDVGGSTEYSRGSAGSMEHLAAGHVTNIQQSAAGVELLNNQLSLASQQLIPSRTLQDERREKNTNIDNFKLGFGEGQGQEEARRLPELSREGCLTVQIPGGHLGYSGPNRSQRACNNSCASNISAEAENSSGSADAENSCGSAETYPHQVGGGSGVLHADVNILREAQDEKTMKPSLSLTFKNNILRGDERSANKEDHDQSREYPRHCGEKQ